VFPPFFFFFAYINFLFIIICTFIFCMLALETEYQFCDEWVEVQLFRESYEKIAQCCKLFILFLFFSSSFLLFFFFSSSFLLLFFFFAYINFLFAQILLLLFYLHILYACFGNRIPILWDEWVEVELFRESREKIASVVFVAPVTVEFLA
jgi:hypothetical protein